MVRHLRDRGYAVGRIASILNRDRHTIYDLLNRRISMAPKPPVLSKRQYEVAVLVSRGFSDKRIARELGITRGTVNNYLREIFLRLNMHNRVELAMWVMEHNAGEQRHER